MINSMNLAINILVKNEPDGSVSATVIGMPEYHVLASERNMAIEQLEQLLEKSLSNSEIIPLHISPKHPWEKYAGIYQESEMFANVLDNIESCRQDERS
jgi:hypothetical protein